MPEMVVLLVSPLAGALTLALFGHRNRAAEVNLFFSVVTFLAAAALTARIVAHGPLRVLHEQFFIDSLNVFLVALTAFVGMTTALLRIIHWRARKM